MFRDHAARARARIRPGSDVATTDIAAARRDGPPAVRRRLVQGRDHLPAARARRSATANGDGIGDFRGLTSKLDYLAGPRRRRRSGSCRSTRRRCATTATTSPTTGPSTPSYGTLADFRRFLREAHARGLRVITELVINHTSDQHPWFQRARRAPSRQPRVATSTCGATRRTSTRDARIIFMDIEHSNWTWDPVAGAYYWHRFYSPPAGPQLRQPRRCTRRSSTSLDYWLDMGVDGLRLDAIPYLYEREGTNCENLPETHAVPEGAPRPHGRAVPGPACCSPRPTSGRRTPSSTSAGSGDECHMGFHFPLMPRHVHGGPAGGPLPDRRHPRADAGHPRDVPVGDLPAQPRRADARDGHRRGARLHVPAVRRGPAGADQPRHPPAPGAAAAATTGARSS